MPFHKTEDFIGSGSMRNMDSLEREIGLSLALGSEISWPHSLFFHRLSKAMVPITLFQLGHMQCLITFHASID